MAMTTCLSFSGNAWCSIPTSEYHAAQREGECILHTLSVSQYVTCKGCHHNSQWSSFLVYEVHLDSWDSWCSSLPCLIGSGSVGSDEELWSSLPETCLDVLECALHWRLYKAYAGMLSRPALLGMWPLQNFTCQQLNEQSIFTSKMEQWEYQQLTWTAPFCALASANGRIVIWHAMSTLPLHSMNCVSNPKDAIALTCTSLNIHLNRTWCRKHVSWWQ